VLISDGVQGDLFVLSNERKKPGEKIFHEAGSQSNNTNYLSKLYQKNAEVVELQMLAYYLGTPPRERLNPQAKTTYSLYRDDLVHAHGAEEIAVGITDFQVKYGVFDPVQGIVYRASNAIADEQWAFVRSVRINIEVDSTSKKNSKTIWEYEFAIRNRNRRDFNSGVDIIDRPLAAGQTSGGTSGLNHTDLGQPAGTTSQVGRR